MGLAKKVITSGFWMQTSQLIQLGSNFIVTAILARLLLPEHFGLIGMLTVYLNFVSNFTNLGLTIGIIQKQNVTQTQLSSVFWINLSFGFLGAIVIILFSPLAAGFYNEQELTKLITISSINFIISPFSQIQRRLLQKELKFAQIAKSDIIANFISGLIGISLAYLGFGVYSLVWQSISLHILNVVTLTLFRKWRPSLSISISEIKEILKFSIIMKAVRLNGYFERNIDSIILGKLFSTPVFGCYTLAYRVMHLPIKRITSVFYDILFPAFSSIQEQKEKIKSGYLKSIQFIAMFTFPVMIFISFYSYPFVTIVFGQKWIKVTEILTYLTIAGAVHALSVMSNPILPAMNKPVIAFKLSLIRIFLIAIAAVIGGFTNLTITGIAILFAMIIIFFINNFILSNYLNLNLKEILNSLRGPLIAGAAMVLLLSILNITVENKWYDFLTPSLIGFSIYIIFIFIMNFNDLKFLYQKIKPLA